MPNLTVIDWNIKRLLLLDMASTLNQYNPDVVCVQEAAYTTDDMAKAADMLFANSFDMPTVVLDANPPERYFGLITFINKGINVVDAYTVALTSSVEPRGVVIVETDSYFVLNSHIEPQTHKIDELNELYTLASSLKKPVIICTDTNEPDAAKYFPGFNNTLPSGAITYPALQAQTDLILVRGLSYSPASVINTDQSDHGIVKANIRTPIRLRFNLATVLTGVASGLALAVIANSIRR